MTLPTPSLPPSSLNLNSPYIVKLSKVQEKTRVGLISELVVSFAFCFGNIFPYLTNRLWQASQA